MSNMHPVLLSRRWRGAPWKHILHSTHTLQPLKDPGVGGRRVNHTPTHTHTHPHTHTPQKTTHARPHTPTHSRTRTRTRTHAHTHTHTHTRTHGQNPIFLFL